MDGDPPQRSGKQKQPHGHRTPLGRLQNFPVPNPCVLPEQFFPKASWSAWSGEQRLMYVILEDAVVGGLMKYYGKPGRRKERLFRQDEEWINKQDPSWIFSFDNCCAVCGFDADYLRSGIRQWMKQQEAVHVAERKKVRYRRTVGRRDQLKAA